MKAKALLLAMVAATCVFTANAQEAPTTLNKAGKHTTFARDKGSAHWFIDIQGGAGIALGGENRYQDDFVKRLSITPTLSVGKWHEPYWATRLQLMAWDQKSYYGPQNALVPAHNYYGVAHFDFLFDLNNYFGVYRPNKVFHVIPFLGLGAAYKHMTVDENGDKFIDPKTGEIEEGTGWRLRPSMHGGIMFKFRCSSRIDINLEGQMMASYLKFKGTNYGQKVVDLNGYATIGLTVNLGKTAWDEVIPMDYALVNDLNGQINRLRAENEELSKRPVSCPECPEVEEVQEATTVINTVSNVVYFKIGSAKIRPSQEINIANIAKQAKEDGQKIYLVGYADKDTGTAAYNLKLSERRAQAVADMLINRYGFSADQIETNWKGSEEQPYTENAWNRIVVMTAE